MIQQMCYDVKRMFFYLILVMFPPAVQGQNPGSRVQEAFKSFESDPQVKHALVSLYIIDAKTGKTVFDRNGQTGLAPASTQKIITSVTAFELLGKDYRYKTRFGFSKQNDRQVLYVRGSGDPTLGSWRWESAKEDNVLSRIGAALKKNGVTGSISPLVDTSGWGGERIPDGWIWQDIGNYYGAGAGIINWRENQYDLVLASGPKAGDPVRVVRTEPVLFFDSIRSVATAGPKGSGDNAYIYQPAGRAHTVVTGTIPAGETAFVISGAMLQPVKEFGDRIMGHVQGGQSSLFNTTEETARQPDGINYIHEELSPPLDSIIYWFNKKSINLYGEALVKTIGYKKSGKGYTREGIKEIRSFWKERGLDDDELNMVDGSGLSPLNRVTTHAQVTILSYAKKQSWYPSFYNALPEYNGMKMKSGTIGGTKGFCGYHKAKDGNEYIFSFLVNNYSGAASSLVAKMYQVLNVLK